MCKTKLAIAAMLLLGSQIHLLAEDEKPTKYIELDDIVVTGDTDNDPTQKKVGERVKSSKTLTKEQVQDTRDLVKYETGVSVVEAGRFGSSGYSIRGVDENRVAITIDGLQQAETLSSQGFKELFEGYGNFNNTRNDVEIETLKQATITKGADSIKTGSGALGGSVMFETKDARDYLLDKDYFYGFKGGYSTANSQMYNSHTLAAKYEWFDILFVHTNRKGHELKNYGYSDYDGSVVAAEREKADPYTIKKESNLLKLGFNASDNTRITAGLDYYKNNAKGHDYSYNLTLSQYSDTVEEEQRYTDDLSIRKNYFVTFENFSETPLWDNVKFTFSNQKIKTRASTEERCFGDKCRDINNPAGLHLDENNNYLDKDNKLLKLKKDGWLIALESDDGTKYTEGFSGGYFRTSGKDTVATNFAFDCDFFNCEKPINLILDNEPVTIDLSSKDEIVFDRSYPSWNGTINPDSYHVNVETIHKGDKTYKKIKSIHKYISWNGTPREDNDDSFSIPIPYSAGFSKNDWRQRDLDSETKQLNLDLEKSFNTKIIEHLLSYGGLYSINKKSMTNIEGKNGTNVKWWANSYLEDCSSGAGNALQCPVFSGEESFLVPTTKKQKAFYISDDIRVNDFISFQAGFRKDFIKYSVDYEEGKSPKIPDGFLGALAKNDIEKPRYTDPKYFGTDPSNSGENHPQYIADRAKFIQSTRIDKKYKGNIFNESSHFVTLNLDPVDFFRFQAKYSKGFRVPTPDELYFNFRFPGFIIVPNTQLKPEIAKTKELALTFYKNSSFITLSGFETKYKDFLDFRYVGSVGRDPNQALSTDLAGYQNVNRASAKVRGIEIDSRINLKDIRDDLPGFYFGFKYTRQKGKVLVTEDGEDVFRPMNAIQPNKFVYNLGYAAPNDKFGADLFITHAAAKKPEDTYNMFWLSERREGIIVNNKKVEDSSAHWLSNKYTTIDFIGYVRPKENITLRFGAYNITDKKYITWESARSIRSFGTTNRVRKSDSLGINRFNAPGRNYKFDFEITF